MIRWVLFTCPNGPALIINPGFNAGTREPPYAMILPTFTPPPGLLGIYTIVPGAKCFHPDLEISGYYNPPPLISGASEYTTDTGLNYCAVLTGPAGTLNGFKINWSTGLGKQFTVSSSMELSAPNTAVMHGQNATFKLTLTSLNGFSGNVSFHLGVVQQSINKSFTPSIYLNPRTLLLKAGGSNSTIVIVQTSPVQPAGKYSMQFYAIPVYGLRFYGDYLATPTYVGNSTSIQVEVT